MGHAAYFGLYPWAVGSHGRFLRKGGECSALGQKTGSGRKVGTGFMGDRHGGREICRRGWWPRRGNGGGEKWTELSNVEKNGQGWVLDWLRG